MKSPAEIAKLTADGTYISSSEASNRFGFTNDYITYLCRRGKVQGHLLGRVWFVNLQSLESYLSEAQKNKEASRKELSERLRNEYHSRHETPAPQRKRSHLPRYAFAALLIFMGIGAGAFAKDAAPVLFTNAVSVTESYLTLPSLQSPHALGEITVRSPFGLIDVRDITASIALPDISVAVAPVRSNPIETQPLEFLWLDEVRYTLAALPDEMISVCADSLLAFLNAPVWQEAKHVSLNIQTISADELEHNLLVSAALMKSALEVSQLAAVAAAEPEPKPWYSFITEVTGFVGSVFSEFAPTQFVPSFVAEPTPEIVHTPIVVAPEYVTQVSLVQQLSQLRASLRGDIAANKPKISTYVPDRRRSSTAVLDTVGDIEFQGAFENTSGATSTFANGINVSSGCFSIAGVCLTIIGGSGITAIGPTGQTQNGTTITLATSSDANIALTITGSGDTLTFTSSWLSTLSIARGGTGVASAPSYGQILVGNGSGGYALTATSSLGLASFAYPFVGNATTTTLTFSNGLVSGASTTINGNLNVIGNATTTNATTTSFAITGLTSALLTTNSQGSVVGSSSLSVPYGGTGASSFVRNTLLYFNGTSFAATSSSPLYVGALAATSSTDLSYFLGKTGFGTTTANWSLQVGGTRPSLAISDSAAAANLKHWLFSSMGGNLYLGTSTDAFATSSIAIATFTNAGNVGIGTTSPTAKLAVHGSAIIGTSTSSFLALNTGTVAFSTSATTTIQNSINSWAIATSTGVSGTNPIISISGSSATSSIGFFVSTTTGMTAGSGVGLPSAMRNMIIVGNGFTQASMAIVNGALCVDADGWCTATTSGRVSAVTFNTGATDVAEMYTSDDELVPGEIVSSVSDFEVERATDESRERVIGIVSTQPGLILGLGNDESGAGKFPIALSGRVPVKVSNENGAIEAGDGLALSSNAPGVAVKATSPGFIVGKALQNYDSPGEGMIVAFVENTYYFPPALALGSEPEAQNIVSIVLSTLLSYGISFEQELVRISRLAVETLVVGSSQQPAGITLFDKSTGEPYCLEIDNGEPIATEGECGSSTQQGGGGSGEPMQEPEPETQPEPQPEQQVDELTDPEPEVVAEPEPEIETEPEPEPQAEESSEVADETPESL